MTTRLRPRVKAVLDSLIAQGVQPTAARNGIGLVLTSPGIRARSLVDAKGLTAAGKYYYEAKGITPPTRFDFEQDPLKKGKSMYIRLLDGTQRRISSWDSVRKRWNLTALGKTFYSKAVDKYIILWPAKVQLTRINGSIFEKDGDYLPSTAIAALGEIEVPRALLPEAQRQRVAEIEAAWRAQQPSIEGETVLLAGYESYIYDPSRPIEFHKQSYSQQGDVETTLNRPLREGIPMRFHGFDGISEDAYHETNGECVSYQMARHIKVKGREAPWTQTEIADMLKNISEELYEDTDEDPYEDNPIETAGFTAKAMVQLCKYLNVPIHVKWLNSKIESYTPEKSAYETVAIHIWGDHCFVVGDASTKRSIVREAISTPKPVEKEILGKIGRSTNTTPSSQFWHLYTGLAPGNYYAYDLQAVRADLLRQYISPRLTMSGTGRIKSLTYNDCKIYHWPYEAHICLKFLEEYSKIRHHSLQYRGESLASFCAMVFDDLNRPTDRPFLTKDIKRELAGRQKGRCAICGDALLQEVDHHIARGASCYGSDGMENLNYICSMCHKAKTQSDHQRMHVEDQNVYMSRFSKETWDAFVMARRPLQVVCNLNEVVEGQACLEIDLRSSRLNAILEANTHDICIFSPLDEIEPSKEGLLGDYSWVDLGVIRSPLNCYIYDGPRWYDKATVQFMFEMGICKWSNISLSFSAACHRPASDLANKLRKMQKVWFEVGSSYQAEQWAGEKAKKKDTKQLLAKTALLSLCGLWGRTENYRHHVVTSSHPDDIPWDGESQSTPTPNTTVFQDVTFTQKILNLGTFLPLHLIGRSQERLQIARALNIIQRCNQIRKVISIQVDAVYVQGNPKRELLRLQNKFARIRYCDLAKVTSPLLASLLRVNGVHTGMTQDACKSNELVYKANLCEPRLPGGSLKVSEFVDPPYPSELEWTTYTEGEDGFLQQILDHVQEGKSFTCLGPPGVGKSYVLQKVREFLEEKGDNVVCLAPTHAAARLIDGDTVHHYVGRHVMQGAKVKANSWILLDEISMCCLGLLAALDQQRLAGLKICTFGDWDQLPVVANSWRGSPVAASAFQDSRLYKLWSDCTCFQLTKCRRSDQVHYHWYTNLHYTLSKAIAQSKGRYPEKEDADLHICISHRRRRAISQAKQARLAKGRKCIEIPAYDDPSYMMFEGTKLVGNATQGKFYNGARYTCIQIGAKVRLQDDVTKEEFETCPENISKNTLLAHAMVYNKVQGSTEKGSVCLHDTSSRYFQRCHLYVGLSRVTHGALVQIADD